MDALHLGHLVALSAWAGCVLAESVVELVATDDAGRLVAARVHFWIDVLVELPLIAVVLVTGALLAARSWPPPPLLAAKIAAGAIAAAINLYCALMVVRRYVERRDAVAVRRYQARVRLSALGIPFAAVAAYIGLAHYAGLP